MLCGSIYPTRVSVYGTQESEATFGLPGRNNSRSLQPLRKQVLLSGSIHPTGVCIQGTQESEATFGLPGRSNSRCSPCTSSSWSLAHTVPRCHRNSPRKASLRRSRAGDLPEMADDRRQQKPTSINHYAAGVSATVGLTH